MRLFIYQLPVRPQGPIEFETLLIVINALESCVYFIVLI